MDTLQFHYDQSIFNHIPKTTKLGMWYDPRISWKLKYKNQDQEQGPAFFGSTTFLVWITDAWHFFQTIMLSSFNVIICIFFYHLICDREPKDFALLLSMSLFIVQKFLYGVFFEMFYLLWIKGDD